MESQDADIAAWLLMGLVMGTLMGLFFMLILIRCLRRRLVPYDGAPGARRTIVPSASGVPVHFLGRLHGWVAVRHSRPEDVRDALGLSRPVYCDWSAGFSRPAPGSRLFISPPVGEWILVFGPRLPTPDEDIDRCFRFLAHLSRSQGEAQYFHSDTVSCQHAWARMVDGQVIRGYAWHQETIWNQGEITDAERKTGVRTFDYEEAPDPAALGMREVYRLNAERVFGIAERWSINPRRIRHSPMLPPGLSGDLSFQRPY